jgi:hypothetical protein
MSLKWFMQVILSLLGSIAYLSLPSTAEELGVDQESKAMRNAWIAQATAHAFFCKCLD